MSNNNLMRGLPVLVAMLAMAGCSTTATNTADISKISQLEEELSAKNTEVETLKSSITQLETSLASQCEQCGAGALGGGVSDLFPPNGNPGECYARIYIPPTYNTVTETVTKKVLVSAATTSEVETPAKYKTVKVKKMVEPPKTNTVAIPAKYEDVTKKTKVTDGGMEWRAILCETNATPAVVSKIQSALSAEGYDVGGVDGVFGAKTVHAIEAYQVDKGLPKGGVTITTLQSLGVQ